MYITLTVISCALGALLKWNLSIFIIQPMFVPFARDKTHIITNPRLFACKNKVRISAMEQKMEQRREQMVRRPLYGTAILFATLDKY